MPFLYRPHLPDWLFMWALAFSIFAACKWLTSSSAWLAKIQAPLWKYLAYTFAWPGMDAKTFLQGKPTSLPPRRQWFEAVAKIAFGFSLLLASFSLLQKNQKIAAAYLGMTGIAFLLHFGLFHVLALAWQCCGTQALALFRAPLAAQSPGDFWGKRWNIAFRDLAHAWIFQKIRPLAGTPLAIFSVFLASGLIHELVISVPARGGYGRPLLYFLLQGLAVLAEASALGKRWRLQGEIRGRLFMLLTTGAPVLLLFHPPFMKQVFIPFLEVLAAWLTPSAR